MKFKILFVLMIKTLILCSYYYYCLHHDQSKKKVVTKIISKVLLKEKKSETEQIPRRSQILTMGFDIKLTTESFGRCQYEQLNLEEYTKGYNELYNFFNMLGTVFGFIASDVREKIDILENFRTDDTNPNHIHYVNVEGMMQHEIEKNKQEEVELLGSRTLLRLHRALEFTFRFLEELGELSTDDKVSSMALKVYGETLAKYHPFLIRNAAKLAMYALPSRKDFMKNVVSPGASESDVKDAIVESVSIMRKVFNEVETLYTKYDLHGLP